MKAKSFRTEALLSSPNFTVNCNVRDMWYPGQWTFWYRVPLAWQGADRGAARTGPPDQGTARESLDDPRTTRYTEEKMALPTHTSETADGLLSEVISRILSVNRPERVVLFGSCARGENHATSDLDLLIVERQNPQPRHRRATPYRVALAGLDRDIDLVVYTTEEIKEWSEVPNAFITTIVREGKVLYEDGGGPG
jgi:predicted nucleotidyltransferase